MKQFLLSMLVGVFTSLASLTPVQAAEMPGLNKQVFLNAREQPVDLFVSELFGQLGIPARVDEGVIGSVNGDFRKSAQEVIDEISAAFQLDIYFDGAIAHVYPANEVQRKVMYMSGQSATSVARAAKKLGLTDRRNTVTATDVGVVATGASRFVDQIDRLASAVGKTPKPTTATHDTYRIFSLKYAWADDVSLVIGGETVVVPGVASLMRSLIEPGALGVAPVSNRTPGSSSLDGLRGQGLRSQGLQEVSQPQTVAQLPAQQRQAVAALSKSTKDTRIVADPLSNSVIIRDRSDRMASYESLIQSLDKEPQMIEIEATIIDLDTDKLRELGINWRLNDPGSGSSAVVSNGTAATELLGAAANVTPAGAGGIVSLILGNQQRFITRIRALESQGAARIVSKPHIMTLANVEALLDTTSTFFVRVAGQEEVDLFDVKVGTRLRVTPHVFKQGNRTQIKMRVNITDGSTSDRTVDDIPIVEESNINTQAIVDVGQSLLIGGLVREIKSNGISRVPFLGRIPVVGGLFRSQIKTSSRQERMFLITPRISAPQVAGKRFSAPVLSGNESDIILSSPTRLQESQQALSLLDEARPVEQRLPAGEGLVSPDMQLAQPFQSIAPEPEPTSPDSLRERLLHQKDPRPAEPLIAQQSVQRPAPQPAVAPLSQPLVDNSVATVASDFIERPSVLPREQSNDLTQRARENLDWQVVGTKVPLGVPTSSNRQPSVIPNAATAPANTVDDNGWQDIN